MLVMDNDVDVALVCGLCGGPILPGQPYINSGKTPIHSESENCNFDEGWNPHMDTE